MEIRINEEVYRELVEIQVEEYESGLHLCEQKLEVLSETDVKAPGGLGFLLANFDASTGSERSHNTTLGYGDEDSYEWNNLTISFFDDEDEQILENVRIALEGGDFFSARLESDFTGETNVVIEVE